MFGGRTTPTTRIGAFTKRDSRASRTAAAAAASMSSFISSCDRQALIEILPPCSKVITSSTRPSTRRGRRARRIPADTIHARRPKLPRADAESRPCPSFDIVLGEDSRRGTRRRRRGAAGRGARKSAAASACCPVRFASSSARCCNRRESRTRAKEELVEGVVSVGPPHHVHGRRRGGRGLPGFVRARRRTRRASTRGDRLREVG